MTDRARRPFWLHQLMEYVIGLALIAYGFQDTDPAVPAVVGMIVLANAAIARGPFGAFKFIGRSLHRWLDVVVMGMLLVAAAQPWAPVSALGRLVLAGITVPLAFLWWYTDWADRSGRRARRAEQTSERSADIGKQAGRAAANAFKAGKRAIQKRSEA